jgi:hypothetical protein
MQLLGKNLELDKVYKFDENRYIVKHRTYHKNASSYVISNQEEYFYIYEFDTCRIVNMEYGRIVDTTEHINGFRLVLHDTEDIIDYEVNMPVREINGEEKKIITEEINLYNSNPKEYNKNIKR